jgi:UPF0755 protein
MKFLTTFLSLFILLSAIAGIGLVIGLKSLSTPGPLSVEKSILIENGSSVSSIAEQLEKEGIISSSFLFKMAQKLFGNGQLKAGEYAFEKNIPMIAILEKLEGGKVIKRSVTIPEGLTSYEIVTLLNDHEYLKGTISEIPAEGTLLPETYSYSLGDTKEAQMKIMAKKMHETLQQAWENRNPNVPLKTKEEALILASLIEKETGVPSERKRIAGVFINRLLKGMPLQTDPTVIYALTQGRHENKGQGPLGRRLLKKDLDIDSPYNTYRNTGLPPGPIANPGKESIEAALHPEKNDYIFFVADGKGGHLFAKTLEEHNYNVANWRKIRAENEKRAVNKDVITEEVNEPLFE